jgi:hypothetical protein
MCAQMQYAIRTWIVWDHTTLQFLIQIRCYSTLSAKDLSAAYDWSAMLCFIQYNMPDVFDVHNASYDLSKDELFTA